MKKKCNRLLAGVLAAVLCFGVVGCSNTKQEQEDSLVYLSYGTGIDENGNYNNKLYGMNGNDVENADPGCFYLSEEEDPVYGGYFYMYPTGNATAEGGSLNDPYYKENKISNLFARCYRSKNLYNWELCGALEGGYSAVVDEEDWCQSNFWAPEVIRNPADGKYYLYFSASVSENYGVESISSSLNTYDRLYLGVAVSDTPVGPFDVLYDVDAATGKRVPTINFKTGCNLEYNWAAIDVSPFFDDNGDFYLYFNKHQDDHYSNFNGVFGMKMEDMATPDYTTVSCLTQAGKVTASNEPGNILNITSGADYSSTESGVNEAPSMIKHNGKYYLTYSSNGYTHIGYSVHQAISDDPLSGFVKPEIALGNPVLDGSVLGYMNGTAHHAFAKKGENLYIIYHRHDSIYGFDASWGRAICADKVQFVQNADGLDVLTANGPTKGLVWLSEDISGYKNLAQSASVQISTGSGVQYLTDGILPFYTVSQDWFTTAESDDITVTLKWEEPVSISSVMVYNAKEADKAFSQVSDMRFKLAEKPEWESREYDYAVIQNLTFPERYWNSESQEYIACAPAVAEFDPILVTELEITIKAADRLVAENKFGEKNTALNLSEIVVLGGAGSNE